AGEGSVVSCYDKNIWKRRFTQWGKLVPSGLGWFGYYNTPGFNALADTVAADWTALADFGGVQAGTEGFPPDTKKLSYWDIDNADKWVIARLLWNPRRNPGELRIEFIRKVYGSAAPEMREFHSIINKIWHDPKNKTFVNCHSSSSVLFEGLIVKTGLEKRLRALLVKAVEKANDPKAKEMISRQLRMFDKFAATLERREVPYVDEATAEWTDPVSTHWEKAVKLKDFKKVSDWRVFRGVKAKHQTIVAVMRDKNNIYLRFTAFDDHPDKMAVPGKSGRGVFPNGDRVEFIFKKKDRGERFFAVGPNGAFYAYPPLKTPWSVKTKVGTKSWTALVSIPLAGLNLDTGKSVLPCRFCRVYRLKGDEREESTLRGISMFNSHISFLTKLHLNAKGK
ncbi:MAG: hypothetical protein KAG97_13725, partial [Victivallales bacterium]|nr:hypothetical protein [Victivallales bacterium]